MSSKKEQLKKLQNKMREDSISLSKFLLIYYGVGNTYNSAKMSHKDVKVLMPYIKRTSFEDVLSRLKDLYLGNIIPVVDCNGDVAPYIKPRELINEVTFCDNIIDTKKEVVEDIIVSENLSRYELALLLKFYKQASRDKEYRIVHDILKSKKKPVKIYRKQKFELVLRGRENND